MAEADRPSPGALVLHGFTSTPQSVQGVGAALAAAGLEVDVPLLPGHGTSIDDLLGCRWEHWSAAAQAAYERLAAGGRRVIVAGLSMGGTLAIDIAARRPGVAGLVAVNAYVDPPAESFRELLRGFLDAGGRTVPSIGNDVADPEAREEGYDETPIEPLLSLCAALDGLLPRLPDVTCPALVVSSRRDHVVPPASSDLLADRVSGPVERMILERSYHVATLDHDRHELERRVVDFALRHARRAGA